MKIRKSVILQLEEDLIEIIDRKRMSGLIKISRTQWIKDAIVKSLTVEDFQNYERSKK